MTSRVKKGIVVTAGALAFVALLTWALRPTAIVVDLVAVEYGALELTVRDEGETRVRDRYVVTAPVSGYLTRLSLEEGQHVAAGAELAHLDVLPLDPRSRTQAAASLEAARDHQRTAAAMVVQTREALAQARRDAARLGELMRAGAASRAELEQAELNVALRTKELEASDFRAQAAAHDVEVARAALLAGEDGDSPRARHLIVRSPAAGRILRIPQESARVVAVGEVLAEIGDPSKLEITTDLVSTEAVKVRPGQPMHIEGWGGEQPLRGRVRLVEPSGFTKVSALGIEEQRVNVIGDLLEHPEWLGDRFRVQVRIVVWHDDRVLKIPWSALVREGDGWRVYVADGGRARSRTVSVGRQGEYEVQVLEGLRAAELVVRHPTDQVADGVRITSR
jgi:HlyD family secretion protein